MAYNQTVTKDRILTTGASAGQVLTVQAGGTSADWQAVPGSILASDTATLANNGTLSLTHEALTTPPVISGWVPTAGASATALLHFDGTDGGTTIEDTGIGSAHSWSVHGNVQLDTAQHKFGSASLLFDGSGDYLTATDNSDWAPGTGDFCVSLQYRPNTVKTTNYLVDTRKSPTGPGMVIFQDAGTLQVYINGSLVINGSAGLTNGAWNMVVVSRASGTLRLFKNGTGIGSASNSTNLTDNAMLIGRAMNDTAGDLDGWLDEFAYWKGSAQYTADFTPPSEAYGDAGSGYRLLAHGVDFTATINGDADQTTITNVSGSTLTNATFSIRA